MNIKSFISLFVLLFALISQPVLAEFSANTAQVPPSATITATMDGSGNAVISWTEPLKVVRVQHYIGHGRKGGFIKDINVGAAKQVVLGDVAKNGGRFNVVTDSGKFLHLECGGNSETTMPTFKGVKLDCSYTDPSSGQLVGALVVE